MDSILLNAKGFGGNNATAAVLSPTVTQKMLAKRHGAKAMSAWQKANETTVENARQYETQTNLQAIQPVYHFDNDVRGGSDLSFDKDGMTLRGYGEKVSLDLPNKYSDMCE